MKKIVAFLTCILLLETCVFGCAPTKNDEGNVSQGDQTTDNSDNGTNLPDSETNSDSENAVSIDENMTMENLSVKIGSFEDVYGALKSNSGLTLAICDKNLTDGTVSSEVMLGTDVSAGIIFRATVGEQGSLGDDPNASYYYFYLQGTQIRFSKIINGESHLIKASDKSKDISLRREAELKVVIDGNNFKGYVDGICYLNYTDENALDGNAVGLRSDASGVVFYNTSISSEKKVESADIVMFGHSHTTHWGDPVSDLSSQGKLVNLGIGGTIIPQWMSRIDELTSYGAKKYVCWLGSNDIRVSIDNDVTVDRLNVLFKKIAEAVPDAEIYLFTEFYQFDSYRVTEEFRSKIRDLNQKYKTSFTGVNIVDIFDVVLLPNGEVNKELYDDEQHLKGDCYGEITSRLLAAMASPVKVNGETGKAPGKYIIGEGTNNAWTYTEGNNGITLVSKEANTIMTLTDKKFAGGTVEFKIYVPSDAAYSGKHNVSGVLFGANDYYVGHGTGNYYCLGQHKNGELVGFAMNNSVGSWVDENKSVKQFLTVGNTHKIKIVWDRENNAIHCFLNDEYRFTTKADMSLYGDIIGFYADGVGVTFSDIRISDKLELDGVDAFFMAGMNNDWTISGSGETASYKVGGGKLMMFNKDFGDADKWVIEYDVTAHDTEYAEKRVSGIVIGAASPVVDKRDTFVATGYCYNSGELNTYSLENGIGRWEDSVKIRNYFPGLNITCHVKLIWDKKAGTIEYYTNGELVATQKLSVKLYGNYFGLVSDFTTTLSNVKITPVI